MADERMRCIAVLGKLLGIVVFKPMAVSSASTDNSVLKIYSKARQRVST